MKCHCLSRKINADNSPVYTRRKIKDGIKVGRQTAASD